MLENKHIRNVLLGVGAVILSEVAYKWCLRLIKCMNEARPIVTADDREKSDKTSCKTSNQTSRETVTTANYQIVPYTPPDIFDVLIVNENSLNCPITNVHHPTPLLSHDDKVCGNESCYTRNKKAIVILFDQAKYSIDIAMYVLTLAEVCWALERAKNRGVKIRVITDRPMMFVPNSQIANLIKQGVPVRFSPPRCNAIMHHKFCILDGPSRAKQFAKMKKDDTTNIRPVLLSGSLNWTFQGFTGNWENIVITSNSVLVTKFEREFFRMWTKFDKPNMAKINQVIPPLDKEDILANGV